MTCVPDAAGDLLLRRGLQEEWKRWVQNTLDCFPSVQRELMQSIVGYRCLLLHDGLAAQDPYGLCLELRLDGSGTIVFAQDWRDRRGELDPQHLIDDLFVGDVLRGLMVLSRHALRTGAIGNALLSAKIACSTSTVLTQERARFPTVLPGSRVVEGSSDATRRTARLEAMAGAAAELLSVVRAFVSDLFSTYGVPNCTRSRLAPSWFEPASPNGCIAASTHGQRTVTSL
jgi:hypothetical protein